MLDLEQELANIIDALTAENVEYALCGGLAMAVHGAPRATIDIDLLVRAEDVERVCDIAARYRLLDLHVAMPSLETVWQTREQHAWRGRSLFVVSRDGLVQLKNERARMQDRADIERLDDRAGTTDMSPHAVTVRLIRVSQLRRLCLSLAKAKPVPPPTPR